MTARHSSTVLSFANWYGYWKARINMKKGMFPWF